MSDFDVIVVGATAPGIVTAVRAAREGLTVALIAAGKHPGGSLPSLGAFESRYRGNRAPLLQECIDAVIAHYRRRYGEDSEQYRACTAGRMITFEPHVAEAVLENLIAAEERITLWREFRVRSVEKSGRLLTAAVIEPVATGARHRLTARAFVEAGDEGDFMALAGARWRLGREGRDEFAEPHAGRVFTRWVRGEFPREAVEGRLNLATAGATTLGPEPGSSGEGDDQVQSCSYRLCLTDEPANRRRLEAPPDGYKRSTYAPLLLSPAEKAELRLPFHHRWQIYSLSEMAACDHLFHGHALPNRKRSWNATNLVGGGAAYPVADEAQRASIARAHRDHALGLLWFLQNDPAMPSGLRAQARAWGLARDEFIDTGNIPRALYVREGRRLAGRATFREQDALIAPGRARAPVHADSIAITDFPLDSLACTTERRPGTLGDGQFFQTEVSRPGQIPFGSLLPRELDNLVVVTPISATHVGWAALRLAPTLMHVAESAAWALVLAARERIAPADVEVRTLQRTLVERGVMITFFNDFDMAGREPWVPAVQYFGAQEFFDSYDARPEEFASEHDGEQWRAAAKRRVRRGEFCAELYRGR